jgi:hypothetical protein
MHLDRCAGRECTLERDNGSFVRFGALVSALVHVAVLTVNASWNEISNELFGDYSFDFWCVRSFVLVRSYRKPTPILFIYHQCFR